MMETSLADYSVLSKAGALSDIAFNKGLTNLLQLVNYVRELPYSRNSVRGDLSLVFREDRGTCSSKHAVVAAIAEEQGWDFVQLILVMYEMTQSNTPMVKDVLAKHALALIPEAHCYLKINECAFDLTFIDADIGRIASSILEAKSILPGQIGQWKVNYHKAYLARWAAKTHPDQKWEALWEIREACIRALENQ